MAMIYIMVNYGKIRAKYYEILQNLHKIYLYIVITTTSLFS